jgi:hypothetical protein
VPHVREDDWQNGRSGCAEAARYRGTLWAEAECRAEMGECSHRRSLAHYRAPGCFSPISAQFRLLFSTKALRMIV